MSDLDALARRVFAELEPEPTFDEHGLSDPLIDMRTISDVGLYGCHWRYQGNVPPPVPVSIRERDWRDPAVCKALKRAWVSGGEGRILHITWFAHGEVLAHATEGDASDDADERSGKGPHAEESAVLQAVARAMGLEVTDGE